jgi:catechol 2,3-dioxygenase-like lactoylglutathione lyase family enzyme
MPSGSPVIDHVLLVVRDLGASRRFYEAALSPLGFTVMYEEEDGVAFGTEGHDDFAVYQGDDPSTRAHVAFKASGRDAVDAFYAAAMANGGRENAAPSIRQEYHAGYYAGFVFDPDGNNIEAVFHDR